MSHLFILLVSFIILLNYLTTLILGSRKQSIVAAKVVCGVCGTLRLYKFLRQARKFGIFSCEPCRRFILKILKMEKQKTLEPLDCSSGTGE